MKDFHDLLSIGDQFAPQRKVSTIVTEVKLDPETDWDITSVQFGDIPVLALRDSVMFSGVTLPVSVGRAKSLALIRDAERNKQPIAVACQIDPEVEDPSFDQIHHVGLIAEVVKVLTLPDDSTTVILQGRQRIRLIRPTAEVPYLRAETMLDIEEVPRNSDKEFVVLTASIHELAQKILNDVGEDGKEMLFAVNNIDNPLYLINFISNHFPMPTADKQALLDIGSMKKRAYKLYSLLSKESQLIAIKADIRSKTIDDLSQQQREHFLQQQLRTIQDELGENYEDEDIDELRARAKKKKWADDVQRLFDKELKKLERLHPQSPDYSVQYGYLDTLLNLPWDTFSKDDFNIDRAQRQLNRDHYGLDKVKDRILEHLAVLKLRNDMKSPIICLYGPPGVGKTSLGKSVAKALKRKYVRVSLGGLHDEAEIRGHRRTYVGALPGRILQGLIKAETSNPVFVLDEVDKLGTDFKGDPSSALLEVLDPEQNSAFHDNYIDFDYDLSKVLFIATANNISTMPQPLLDRMELIEVTGYIMEEKIEIARRHLIPKALADHGFDKKEIEFPKAVIAKIIDSYTRESGVRELEKKISKVLRRIARLKATDQPYSRTVTPTLLREYLGAPEYNRDSYEGNDFAGVVTGLAWTAVGGEILFVESSLSKGKGEKLTLTGNLGDVMKESAVIALQYLKSHSYLFGINDELFDKYNVHIHVPEGAIPKDGPSAGITMVTSLASTFTQRRVKANLAMTGEITLRGRVLPVGGIKEKILAAKRAGIAEIILCDENRKDIEEINPDYLKGLTFHYVHTVKEVIDIALTDQPAKDAVAL